MTARGAGLFPVAPFVFPVLVAKLVIPLRQVSLVAKPKEKIKSFSLRSLTHSRTTFILQALHLNLFQNTEVVEGGQLCHPPRPAEPVGQDREILLAGGEMAEINHHIVKSHIPQFSKIGQ